MLILEVWHYRLPLYLHKSWLFVWHWCPLYCASLEITKLNPQYAELFWRTATCFWFFLPFLDIEPMKDVKIHLRGRQRHFEISEYNGQLLIAWINSNRSMESNHMPSKVWDRLLIHSQGSTLSFLAGCPKSHFLGWYRNFLVYWYLKLDNQVVNSTCRTN